MFIFGPTFLRWILAGCSRTGLCHDWLLFKAFYCFGKGLGWKGEGRVIVFFFSLSSYSGYYFTDSKRMTKSAEPTGTTSASTSSGNSEGWIQSCCGSAQKAHLGKNQPSWKLLLKGKKKTQNLSLHFSVPLAALPGCSFHGHIKTLPSGSKLSRRRDVPLHCPAAQGLGHLLMLFRRTWPEKSLCCRKAPDSWAVGLAYMGK